MWPGQLKVAVIGSHRPTGGGGVLPQRWRKPAVHGAAAAIAVKPDPVIRYGHCVDLVDATTAANTPAIAEFDTYVREHLSSQGRSQ